MPTKTQLTNEQKLKLAEAAILHILHRIQRDPKVAELLGVATKSFSYLTAAFAVLNNEELDSVRETVLPGSTGINHDSLENILEMEGI